MEEYKKVEIVNYVKQGIENGTMTPRQAKKFAKIIAKQGKIGEKVISWSVDLHGNEIQEKVAQVQEDEQTKQPGWIATKVDEAGNIIIDKNNHPNQWIIGDSTFRRKYEIDPENIGLFRPKDDPQLFVQISENIILNSNLKIAAGGYINITNVDNMYGISQRDFEDTYRFINELEKKGPRF